VQVDDVVNDALLLLLLLLLSAITTCRSELATCNKLGEVSTAVALEEIRVDFCKVHLLGTVEEEDLLLPRLELIVEEAFDSGVAALIDDLDVGVVNVNSSFDTGALTGVVVVVVVVVVVADIVFSELLIILAEEGVVTFDDEDELPAVDGYTMDCCVFIVFLLLLMVLKTTTPIPGDDDDDCDDDRDDDLDCLASAVLCFNTSSFTDPRLTVSPVGLHTEAFLLLTLLINQLLSLM